MNTLEDLRKLLSAFFHPEGGIIDFLTQNFSIIPYVSFMVIGLIFMFPIGKKLSAYLTKKKYGRLILDLILIALLAVSICSLVNSSYNPFIYFRF